MTADQHVLSSSDEKAPIGVPNDDFGVALLAVQQLRGILIPYCRDVELRLCWLQCIDLVGSSEATWRYTVWIISPLDLVLITILRIASQGSGRPLRMIQDVSVSLLDSYTHPEPQQRNVPERLGHVQS